jgi:hypothetical protein
MNQGSPTSFEFVPSLSFGGDWIIADMSNVARRLTNHPDGAVGTHIISLVHRCDMCRVICDLTAVLNGTRTVATWLLRLRAGSGGWNWFRIRVERRRDSNPITVDLILLPV